MSEPSSSSRPPNSANPGSLGLLLVLALIQFTAIVDFMLIMPLGPLVNQELSLSPAGFGGVVSAYAFAAGLAGLLAAPFIDRFDRRHALLATYAGFAVATLLCGLAPEFWSLVAARAAAGACGGLLGASVFAIVGDTFPEHRRGMATGVVMGAFGVATVVGVPAGLSAADWFSNWRAPFLVLGAASVAICGWMWFAIPPCRRHLIGPQSRPGLVRLMTHPPHARAFALMSALVFGGFTVIPYISLYVVNNVGLAQGQLRYVYLAGGSATLLAMPIIGRLSDRFGKRTVFQIVAVVSTIPVLILTNLPAGTPLAVVLLVSTLFMTLMAGRGVPATALVTSAAVSAERGAFLSVNSAAQQIAAGLAVQIAALLMNAPVDPAEVGTAPLTGYNVVGWLAIAFTFVAVVAAFGVRPAVARIAEEESTDTNLPGVSVAASRAS